MTPWGDTFEGFSPANRPVLMERNYLWADGPGGDILCEVAVFPNAVLYDHAARRSARVSRPLNRRSAETAVSGALPSQP